MRLRTIAVAAAAAAALLLFAPPAPTQASEMDILLKKLVQKGLIPTQSAREKAKVPENF